MKSYNVLVYPDGKGKPKNYTVTAKTRDDAMLWGLLRDGGVKFPPKVNAQVIADHIELAKMYCEIV